MLADSLMRGQASDCARVLARVYFAGLLGWWAAKLLITYAACDSHRPPVGESQLDLLASFQWCTPVLQQYLGMCSTLRPAKAFAMCRQGGVHVVTRNE